MDAAHLAQLILYGGILFVLVRFLVTTLDRAESGFASLFVPPDRTLGWPRGVQESDEPWAWRAPTAHVEDPGLEPPGGPGERTMIEAPAADARRSLVVPVRPVAPVHFNLRPH